MTEQSREPQTLTLHDGTTAIVSLDPGSPTPPFAITLGKDCWFQGTIAAPKNYFFIPQEDITAYELAKCTELMIKQLNRDSHSPADWYVGEIEALPDNIRRHWSETDTAQPAA